MRLLLTFILLLMPIAAHACSWIRDQRPFLERLKEEKSFFVGVVTKTEGPSVTFKVISPGAAAGEAKAGDLVTFQKGNFTIGCQKDDPRRFLVGQTWIYNGDNNIESLSRRLMPDDWKYGISVEHIVNEMIAKYNLSISPPPSSLNPVIFPGNYNRKDDCPNWALPACERNNSTFNLKIGELDSTINHYPVEILVSGWHTARDCKITAWAKEISNGTLHISFPTPLIKGSEPPVSDPRVRDCGIYIYSEDSTSIVSRPISDSLLVKLSRPSCSALLPCFEGPYWNGANVSPAK